MAWLSELRPWVRSSVRDHSCRRRSAESDSPPGCSCAPAPGPTAPPQPGSLSDRPRPGSPGRAGAGFWLELASKNWQMFPSCAGRRLRNGLGQTGSTPPRRPWPMHTVGRHGRTFGLSSPAWQAQADADDEKEIRIGGPIGPSRGPEVRFRLVQSEERIVAAKPTGRGRRPTRQDPSREPQRDGPGQKRRGVPAAFSRYAGYARETRGREGARKPARRSRRGETSTRLFSRQHLEGGTRT